MAEIVLGSPEWWLRELYGRIVDRRPHLDKLHAYYDGDHPLAFTSTKFRQTFGGLFEAFADNWCEIVVDATEERLNVSGFRVDPDRPDADDNAWRIWQENDLDARSGEAHTEALIAGESYALPWFGDGDGDVEVALESAANVEVARHPKFRRRRMAALRVWTDEWGFDHAEVHLPDRIVLFRAPQKGNGTTVAKNRLWVPDPEAHPAANDDGEIPNPLGVVAVVPLSARPRLTPAHRHPITAMSELKTVIPVQDGVNKLVADMIVASEAAALPMRYATGYEVAQDDNGQAVQPEFTKPGAMWAVLEEEQAKVGSLPGADLSGFVRAIEMLIQHIASISRTPPHYLNASADRLSGESIKAAETGLVAKVRKRQRTFGEGWEEVMRLAGRIVGDDQLAAASRAETMWSDPESRTEAELVDAALKKKSINVPDQQLWTDVGYSPQEIARFQAMRGTDALMALLGQDAPEPATGEPAVDAGA